MAANHYETALVTGASSGIGEAVVESLCERGMQVIAVARRSDRINELAARTGCRPLLLDLCDTDALYHSLETEPYDVVVNNAGLGRGFDQLINATRDDIDRVIHTNVNAAIHVLRATLPGMIARKRGHVFNIGSVAGLYPISSALYGASKGAIHLLQQNLRLELKGTRVRCTEICPGRVKTEFFHTALDDRAQSDKMNQGFTLMQSADIAAAVAYALDAPWNVNISLIEMTPTEQHFGGVTAVPVD